MATEPEGLQLETPPKTDPSAKVVETAAAKPEKETVAEKTAETAGTAAGTETETETEADDTTDTDIKQWLKDELGFEVEKYASGEEALKGVREKLKLALRKDEDAEYGRQMKTVIGGREAEILAAANANKTATAGKEGNGAPDFDPAWEYQITTDVDGKLAPATGAPKDVVEKYVAFRRYRENLLNEFAAHPEQLLDKLLSKKTAELEGKAKAATQAELAVEREQLAVEAWQQKNAERLFVDPTDPAKGLSSFGDEVDKYYQQLTADGMPNRIKRLAYAEQLAGQSQAAATVTRRKVPGKAVRQPAIATPANAAGNLSVRQMLDKMSFEDVVKLQNESVT